MPRESSSNDRYVGYLYIVALVDWRRSWLSLNFIRAKRQYIFSSSAIHFQLSNYHVFDKLLCLCENSLAFLLQSECGIKTFGHLVANECILCSLQITVNQIGGNSFAHNYFNLNQNILKSYQGFHF